MKRYILTTALILAATPAVSQTLCLPRADLVATLETRHDETARVRGTIGEGAILEIWGSAESGTWTAVRTTAGGVSCVLAVGQDFVQFAPVAEGDPL